MGAICMKDVGWVWEGHGLDPGVHPSIFGIGEGAAFFGLSKVHFLFHPTTDLALQKLAHLDEVVCDISKWGFIDTDGGGSQSLNVAEGFDDICAEARQISRFSNAYPNVTGAIYDDMKGLMEKRGEEASRAGEIVEALKSENDRLKLWSVVYSHELDAPMWDELAQWIDIVHFWVWHHWDLKDLDAHIDRCRERFPDKPIVLGCYLRDYHTRSPLPMGDLRHQWQCLARALDDGRVQGYAILGTVLIDGQLEQATWIRDFIRDHS